MPSTHCSCASSWPSMTPDSSGPRAPSSTLRACATWPIYRLCATTRRLRIYGQRDPLVGTSVTVSVTPAKVAFSASTSSPTTP